MNASVFGFQVLIYLVILAGLLYFTKKKLWHDVPRGASEAARPEPQGYLEQPSRRLLS